ncbi:hypothetical protein PXH66_22070 [Synoicihabitans lomoniglobus]|uniref:Uncharacterized protein n=1 Tax=Synoicihabitans lomoniglobus TaxID=2909285 RepID=A0AAF0CNX9_9BACT|nr:hypothetical protein PXH66_22070 [Opitutaceae bacterium LMO-M01]
MIKLCEIDPATDEKLPENFSDKSGVGVHYVSAFIKQLTTKLDDGTKVMCKRRGLKLMLRVNKAKGEGLLRRLEHGPDVKTMLKFALEEAAADAGATIEIRDDGVYLEPPVEAA